MNRLFVIESLIMVLIMALCAGTMWVKYPLVSLIAIGLLLVYLFFFWFFMGMKE